MSHFINIPVPALPESVADATIAKWYKVIGDSVKRDEVIVDIETDKIVLELPSPSEGVIEKLHFQEGDTVQEGQIIAVIKPMDLSGELLSNENHVLPSEPVISVSSEPNSTDSLLNNHEYHYASPSVRRMIAEQESCNSDNKGEKKADNREILFISNDYVNCDNVAHNNTTHNSNRHRTEKRVPMSRLRQRVAERLLEAKNATAMLTTFNEINMQPIMALRKQYGELFEKRHGIRLGFMSFYLKAVVEALKRYPEINASLDGQDIVYHNYFDISIAISTARGLVTPVLRDVDALSMSDLEKGIKVFAQKGQEGRLTVDDLTGGTFTITNGGVFGSLMSTPIINPPQSAILGMHTIKDRPMAVNGQVVILPMMYVALSYDHRIVDGKESIGFLLTIKELLEEPSRLLLDI